MVVVVFAGTLVIVAAAGIGVAGMCGGRGDGKEEKKKKKEDESFHQSVKVPWDSRIFLPI